MTDWLRANAYYALQRKARREASYVNSCVVCSRRCRKDVCSNGCRLALKRHIALKHAEARETQAIENVLRHLRKTRKYAQRQTLTQEDAWLNRSGISYEP